MKPYDILAIGELNVDLILNNICLLYTSDGADE